MTLAQEEGFAYFAGYLGKKSKDTALAKIKSEITDKEFVSSNWIDAQNMGKLQYPTKQLVEDMKEDGMKFRWPTWDMKDTRYGKQYQPVEQPGDQEGNGDMEASPEKMLMNMLSFRIHDFIANKLGNG